MLDRIRHRMGLGRKPAQSGTRVETVPGGKLNVGSGRFPLAGWVNLDIQDLPEVDRVVDVRDGLPYRDAAFVYAEHFIEHLTFREALGFFRSAHAALAPAGRIRVSTPNLRWVWATHDPAADTAEEVGRRTFVANRAFYGWQHRFIWTRELLGEAIRASGFLQCSFHGYGESDTPELRGVEQHDRYPDSADLPHVLIVEATKAQPDPERLDALMRVARESFLDHLSG